MAQEDAGTTTTTDSGATTPPETTTTPPESGAGTSSPETTTGGVDLDSLISPESKEKPWFKDIKSADNPLARLVKDHENAQKLLGTKGVEIPGEDATPEQVQEFNRLLGVSEKAEDYAYKAPQWGEEDKAVGEILDKHKDETVVAAMVPVFQELGLSPKKAEKLVAAYDNVIKDKVKALYEAEQAADAERDSKFVAEVQSLFGRDADSIMKNAGDLLQKVIPDSLVPRFVNMSPEDLASVAALLHHTYTLYGREGTFSTKGGEASHVSDRREEIKKLMTHPAARDEGHPEHEKVRATIDNFYRHNF